jgi:hypothetical protein
MSSSISVTGIDSPAEAAVKTLSQVPVERIEKIVFIPFNEPTPATLTDAADIANFHSLNAAMPLEYREDYQALIREAGSCKKYSTVMVYLKGGPEAYSLVCFLNAREDEDLPFGGRFTAGPFEDVQAAQEFAVKLLVREGHVIEEGAEFVNKWRLSEAFDPEKEEFTSRADLLEAFQECLEGLEYFHIFASLKIPSRLVETGSETPVPVDH